MKYNIYKAGDFNNSTTKTILIKEECNSIKNPKENHEFYFYILTSEEGL